MRLAQSFTPSANRSSPHERLPTLIFYVNSAYRTTSWNSDIELSLGWPRGEWLERHLRDLFPAKDQPTVDDLLMRAGEGCPIEGHLFVKRDGTLFPGSCRLTRLPSENGFTVVLQDISLLAKRSRQLDTLRHEFQKRQAELDAIVNVMPVGLGISHDKDCRTIRLNPAFAQLLGLAVDCNGSLTAPPGERPRNFRVLDDAGNEVAGERLPMQVAARTGKEVRAVEFTIERDDGTTIRLLEYATPLVDANGRPAGSVGAFIDITERTRMEARNKFLVRLDDAVRALSDPEEIVEVSARILGEHLGADRCAYSEVEANQDSVCITGNYRRDGIPSIVGRLKFSDFGEECVRTMRENKPYIVHDVDSHEPPITNKEAYRQTQIQSVICVPLHKEGRLVAAMVVHQATPRRWAPGDVDLVRTVAGRCWEALARARITKNLERTMRAQKVLADNATQLLAEDDPRVLIENLFREVGSLLELECCFNYILSEDGTTLRLNVCRGVDGFCCDEIRHLSLGQAICGSVAVSREGRTVDNVQRSTDPAAAWIRRLGIEAYACFPLIAEGELLGTLSFGSRKRTEFSEEDLSLLRAVADQVAMALFHARSSGILKASEERFRRLADTAPVMIWISEPSGAYTWFNAPWLKFTGKTIDEQRGDAWKNGVHPEDLPRIEAARASFDARQESELEYRLLHRSGEYRWVVDHRVPLFGGEHEFLGYIGGCVDIHDRKRVERELAESEARFRQLANTIPQLAWMARPDGIVIWYNDQWYSYTGTTPDEMADGWQKVHHPEELPRVLKSWRQSLETGQPWEDTFSLRSASGEYRWHLTRARPLINECGEIVLWFGTNTDITEQRRLSEEREQVLASERAARSEAERVSRMKDEFLATLSHELRTPLNAVLGWSQLLNGKHRDEKLLREGLTVIARNARAQAQLIEDLLDMSRIISGKIRLDVQRIDPVDVINGAIQAVEHAAEAKGLRVEKLLAPDAGPISGDPGRLQQVIWNLLTNAVKFTPHGGSIKIELQRSGSYVEISISDTGQGISQEFLPYVFDRFRQADSSTIRRHGGLGIGLSLVKQLVEMHGGTVAVSSPGEGRGAVFSITLPLSLSLSPHEDTSVQSRRGEPHPVDIEVDLSGLQVLIVDDEPDAQNVAKRLLEERGAEVLTSGSAEEAMECLISKKPDVLVSDIGMPGKDGYELIRWVRMLPPENGGQTPAAALTAFARAEDRRKALIHGYNSHIVKPVEPTELVMVVANLAGRMVQAQL